MISRIELSYEDSKLYCVNAILAEQTCKTWSSYGLDPTNFWETIRRNYDVIGGQFILDRLYIEENLDTDDHLLATVLWYKSSLYDNGLTEADRTFLKLKWNFK